MRIILLRALLLLFVLSTAGVASAQTWPAKPIRFIVPWPAGGLNDLLARVYSDPVSAAIGQPIVLDFKPGAGGRIGMAQAAVAAPDGHTIAFGNLGPLTIYPHLYKELGYDPRTSFTPIAMLAASPLVLVTNKDLPAANVAELLALAKKRSLNIASIGIGSAQHLFFEIFKNREPFDAVHVPYKGTNESMPAMLAGQIDAMFETLPSVLPLVRDGRIKALAVTTPQRVPLLPDVPSLAEAGYPGLEVTTWYAVVAPAGTPKAALDRLSAEYRRIGELPKTQQFLAEQGLIYVPVSPEEFTQQMLKESERWATIIRQQNIKVE